MSEQAKDGGPAFPHPNFEVYSEERKCWVETGSSEGMSLRDWFAGQALAAVVSACRGDNLHGRTLEQHFAMKAYALADAMLAARDPQQ